VTNLDASLPLCDDVQIRIAKNGQVSVLDAAIGEFTPLDPEGLYLLSLLSLGGSVGSAAERGGFETDETFQDMLDAFITRGLVSAPGAVAFTAPAQPDRGGGEASAPIFVLGHPRSGTTLMRWILDSHPRICCVSDSYIIRTLRQAFWSGTRDLQNLRRMGIPDSRLKELVVRFIGSIYDIIAKQAGKQVWADKTNVYAEHADFLAWLYDSNCRFVIVVRHGFDVVSSDFFDKQGWGSGGSAGEGSIAAGFPLEGHLRAWVKTNEYLHRFLTRNPRLCIAVRYEDMVREPDRWAKEVFTFLGESYPADLLDKVFEHDHDPTRAGPVFEDPKIRSTKKVETDRVDRWRQWPEGLSSSLAEIANPALRLWGYDEIAV
jgi:hypothetical protein